MKQEVHGPHRSPEKTVQINKHIWLYHNVDEEKKKTLLTLWDLLVPQLNKLESPSSKSVLCQVWLKLTRWFWRRGFFNFVNVFSLFHNYLLLEKGGTLHLNKLASPSPKDALYQVWLKLAQWFWRRSWKCEMFTTTTTRTTTDNGQIFIRKAHSSLRLRWAKKNLITQRTMYDQMKA